MCHQMIQKIEAQEKLINQQKKVKMINKKYKDLTKLNNATIVHRAAL